MQELGVVMDYVEDIYTVVRECWGHVWTIACTVWVACCAAVSGRQVGWWGGV